MKELLVYEHDIELNKSQIILDNKDLVEIANMSENSLSVFFDILNYYLLAEQKFNKDYLIIKSDIIQYKDFVKQEFVISKLYVDEKNMKKFKKLTFDCAYKFCNRKALYSNIDVENRYQAILSLMDLIKDYKNQDHYVCVHKSLPGDLYKYKVYNDKKIDQDDYQKRLKLIK